MRTRLRLPYARYAAIAACLALLSLGAEPSEAGDGVRTVPAASTAGYGTVAMSGMQLAAREGLTYQDARTHVILQGGNLRLRLYPGTNKAVVAGREYSLKDRIQRSGGDVYLTARVARFLHRQVASFRATESARRTAQAQGARAGNATRKRAVVSKVRKKPTPRPAAKAASKPRRHIDSGAWAPSSAERDWRYIVLHHSDDDSGSVAKYDRYHRYTKRWEHGCGYHFVIGNGTETGDGEVEMGPRWTQQLHGAHAKTPDNRYNDHGVGICLVGDFDEGSDRPTAAQMDALVELTRWLKERYQIADAHVYGHCDCCSTCCPGKNFPWAEFRRRTR